MSSHLPWPLPLDGVQTVNEAFGLANGYHEFLSWCIYSKIRNYCKKGQFQIIFVYCLDTRRCTGERPCRCKCEDSRLGPNSAWDLCGREGQVERPWGHLSSWMKSIRWVWLCTIWPSRPNSRPSSQSTCPRTLWPSIWTSACPWIGWSCSFLAENNLKHF